MANAQTLVQQAHDAFPNVGAPERWVSVLGGGVLLLYGAKQHDWKRILLMTVGGGLLHRAVTGRCQLYRALGIDGSKANKGVTSVRHREGVKIEQSTIIHRSPEALFHFWRNFENLPSFMNSVRSVRRLSDGRSHWIVNAPAGKTVEWDAEVHNEIENELIAWRSLKNSDIHHAGSVRFRAVPGGTEVIVTMSYEPPFGVFGSKIARFLGEDPSEVLQADLRRFKQAMESSNVESDEIKQRSI